MRYAQLIAAAVYLEEFAPKNKWTDLIEVNINNLAAVPSIVFGLFGLGFFIATPWIVTNNAFGMRPLALTLIDGTFHQETQPISSFAKWRGLADAASSGTWTFREGAFVLTRYEVDATYDGESNPVTVYSAAGN